MSNQEMTQSYFMVERNILREREKDIDMGVMFLLV